MSSGPSRRLTTTSYALLGLLGVRPMAAYELAKQAVETIGLVAASAESGMYAELRRLESGGLIGAHVEWVGRRRRTVYRITGEGRDALMRWLAAPAGPPGLDFPAMVKVLFAEQGTLDDLRRTLEAVRDEAAALRRVGAALAQPYLEGVGAFSHRSHVNVLLWRFLFDFHGMVERWAEWALDHTASWTDTADDDAKRREAVDAWRAALAQD